MPWYYEYRKEFARDVRRGQHITSIEELWRQLEFEEDYSANRLSVNPQGPPRQLKSFANKKPLCFRVQQKRENFSQPQKFR